MEGQISKADKLAIIELLFLRGSEDSINSQRWIFQLTLLFSFITYFILLILNKNFFSHTFYNLHIIVFVFSLALCILSYIYTSSFYKIIPVPKLVMLSPVRNLILFQMLFFILFL